MKRFGPQDSLSIKSQRVLKELGVLARLDHGESLVLVGATYEVRKQAGTLIRVAFVHDEQGRLCVGYASKSGGEWELVEAEPFSQRTLGYYQRRVKRLGDFVENARQ